MRMGRGSSFSVTFWLVLLLGTLFSGAQAQGLSPWAKGDHAVAVLETSFRIVGNTVDSGSIAFPAGFFPQGEDETPVLALAVFPERNLIFGVTWKLRVVGAPGLLGSGRTMNSAAGPLEYVDLASSATQLVPGNTYSAVLGYNRQSGAVLISVVDEGGRIIYRGSLATPGYGGELLGGSKTVGGGTASPWFEVLSMRAFDEGAFLLPSGDDFPMVVLDGEGHQRSSAEFNTGLSLTVNNHAGSFFQEELRLIVQGPQYPEGKTVFVGKSNDLPVVWDIAPYSLLPGDYSAVLQYQLDEGYYEVGRLHWQVKKPAVEVSFHLPSSERTLLLSPDSAGTGEVVFESAMDLPGVRLEVNVTGAEDHEPRSLLVWEGNLSQGRHVYKLSWDEVGFPAVFTAGLTVNIGGRTAEMAKEQSTWPLEIVGSSSVALGQAHTVGVVMHRLDIQPYLSDEIRLVGVYTSPQGKKREIVGVYYRYPDRMLPGVTKDTRPDGNGGGYIFQLQPDVLGKWKYEIWAEGYGTTRLIAQGEFTVLAGLAQEEPAEEREALTLYVSPQGDDRWSGLLPAPDASGSDGPLRTIRRAQELIREIREDRKPVPIVVYLRGGTYFLDEPLLFTPEDSGTPEAPVVFGAYPGERPVLSGGQVITGWREEGELWQAQVSKEWYFKQLFANGERRQRARHPNTGYLRTAGPLPGIVNPSNEMNNRETRVGFLYNEGDLAPWENLEDVNVVLYQAWATSRHWIEKLDPAAQTVRFTNGSSYPVGMWFTPRFPDERNIRYYVENYLAALDVPGEWYFDHKKGVLYYWPMPGEVMEETEVIVPRLTRLVEFKGTSSTEPVAYIRFEGISFQHVDWDLPKNVHNDIQAAAQLGAAVVVRNGEHIQFVDCEFAHLGEYAVWFAQGSRDNRIERAHMYDLGAGGVKIGERETAGLGEVHSNTVTNSIIRDGGHVFAAGVGVLILKSSWNTVSHNSISDFLYSGISVGWDWHYGPSNASYNLIEYNHIYNLGQGVLSDLGGVYTLGESPGTIVRGNLIHDVYSYSYGGWGLYADASSSYIVFEDNIVYATKSHSFHQNYGKENVVRNNILADSWQAGFLLSRPESHRAMYITNNIVLSPNGRMVESRGNGNYHIDRNLYWHGGDSDIPLDFGGGYFIVGHPSFTQWRMSGYDRNGLVADPLFENLATFTLRSDSPAYALGFRDIEFSKIGLYGDAQWVSLPQRVPARFGEVPPLPKMFQPVDDDFEDTAVGTHPKQAVIDEKKGSVRVTDEDAASGKRSLRFYNEPGHEYVWLPMLQYNTDRISGDMHLRFSVKLGPKAALTLNWRDANSQYVGPKLVLKDGKLFAGNTPLTVIPAEEWLEINIYCSTEKGSYDLALRVGDREERFTGLQFETRSFGTLAALEFMSTSAEESVFYLDDIHLSID